MLSLWNVQMKETSRRLSFVYIICSSITISLHIALTLVAYYTTHVICTALTNSLRKWPSLDILSTFCRASSSSKNVRDKIDEAKAALIIVATAVCLLLCIHVI